MVEKSKDTNNQKPVRKKDDFKRKAPQRPIGDRIIENSDTTNSTGPRGPRNEKNK